MGPAGCCVGVSPAAVELAGVVCAIASSCLEAESCKTRLSLSAHCTHTAPRQALADYMESKRRAFPRFYFVSTADLLDILSNGNNPVRIMQHMSKCFQVRHGRTPTARAACTCLPAHQQPPARGCSHVSAPPTLLINRP